MTRPPLGLAALRPPANLTGAFIQRLAEEIRSGRLPPGTRLPTEQELMREAGVSRTVVREAVAALRAEGLVVTRQGVGAFVADRPGEGVFRLPEARNLAQVLDVLELRLPLEVEAAGLAAARRDTATLDGLAAAETAFERAIAAGEDAAEADLAFHRAVSAATANTMYAGFLDFLGRHAIPRRTVGLVERDPRARAAYLARVAAEHRAVADAVRAGDPVAARGAMRRHLEAARERYRRLAGALLGPG